jgi:hypothetical protein
MKIVIGRTTKINVNEFSKNSPAVPHKKKKNEDKRKNKQDRRKNVRDGVIVSLSFKNDRRVRKDRRKKI